MNFWNTVAVGFKEIWAQKFRALLTMLGIILGVSSLVAMSALVQGMENGLREALVAMGGLEKIRVEQREELPVYQRHLADQSSGITLKDVYTLQRSAPLIESVNPAIEVYGFRDRTILSYRGKMTRPFNFTGTWPNSLAINEHVVERGRMFNEMDDETAASVCVIGTGIRDELFGDADVIGEEIDPVGEIITINGQAFTIVGMFQHYESERAHKEREWARLNPERYAKKLASRSPGWARAKGGDWIFRLKNNTVYIPLNTMLIKFRSVSGTNNAADSRLTTLNLKIPDVAVLEPALQQARNILMLNHQGIDDFTFRTQEDQATEVTTAIENARMSRGIISSICLIIGGIGIMNIMLASISERVREIGIRKAVGATHADVFVQILIESVVIAVMGGLVGLIVSYGLVQVIASFTPTDNAPVIRIGPMILAFACSAGVGVAAGLFPAFKASRLHPIQALRYD